MSARTRTRTESSNRRVRQETWSEEETTLLLDLIAEKDIIRKIDGSKGRNQQYYKILEDEFAARNIGRDLKQITTKIKNLRSCYYKALKAASQSGAGAVNWPFFDKMHSLMSDRPRAQAVQGNSARVDTMEEQFGSESTDPCNDEIVTEEIEATLDIVNDSSMPDTSSSIEVDSVAEDDGEISAGDTSMGDNSSRNRQEGLPRPRKRKASRDAGWDRFISTYNDQCEKERAFREKLVVMMSDSMKQSIQFLAAHQEPAVVFQMPDSMNPANDDADAS